MTKEELKQYIDDNIYENQDGEITGESLNDVLKAIVDDVGTEVEANPTGEATTPLNKIKIGETNYNIPQIDTSNLATKTELQQGLASKQDTISDLQQIRTRADEGHTALQPIQDATPNNFVSFDADGAIKDSTYKAADFVQDITRGGSTLIKTNGVVDIPEEIENVVATPVVAGGSPTVDLTNGTLTLGIPRGAAAVNPFKGWWPDLATLKDAITATAGDYAYVLPAVSTDPVSIYEYDSTASTDNYWANSGRTFNPANNQEFASGEELNTVNIDNTHLASPVTGSLAKADDVKDKISEIETTVDALNNFATVSQTGFFFVDEQLNIGAYIDNNGIHSPNIPEVELY